MCTLRLTSSANCIQCYLTGTVYLPGGHNSAGPNSLRLQSTNSFTHFIAFIPVI